MYLTLHCFLAFAQTKINQLLMTQYVSFPFILILCEMSTQVKTYNKFVILILLLHQLFSETLGEITGKLQRNMNNLVFIVTVPIFTVYKSCSRQLLFVPCLKKKKTLLLYSTTELQHMHCTSGKTAFLDCGHIKARYTRPPGN